MGGKKIKLHRPGIEPGSQPWQGCILPLDHRCIRHVGMQKSPYSCLCRESGYCLCAVRLPHGLVARWMSGRKTTTRGFKKRLGPSYVYPMIQRLIPRPSPPVPLCCTYVCYLRAFINKHKCVCACAQCVCTSLVHSVRVCALKTQLCVIR